MGPSGASFPLCKKQKTVLSEAEVIGEQQLFEPFVPYGQPDGSKAGLKVPRDSITSSDYISQAIGDDASPIVIERSLKNRAIKDKSKADLESYVEKYHTRVSEYMNVDIEQLVLSMAEAILNPNAGTTSDRVLEYAIDMEHAIDMAEVPALDKCNLFQVVGDMLKDAVMKLTITLKKLETKHAQWMASLTNEQASSRARANQIRCLLESIKGEETGESNPQRYVIEQLQKEVAALKRKVGIQASHHVQTAELAQAEKEKADLADSLAKEKEEKKKMAETMAILQGRLMELQTIWDTHSCVPTSVLPETSSLSEQLITAKAANVVLEKQASTARLRITELETSLAENTRKIEILQKEMEQERKEKANQQKTITDLNSRLKGNITLSHARRIIWSEIISAVTEQWGFLKIIEETKSSVLYLSRKFQDGDLDLSSRAQHAWEYISFLKRLRADDAEQHGIVSRFKEVVECQKIIDKEAARVNASRALQQVAANVEQFDTVWAKITTAGLPSCWDPTNPSMLRSLTEYETRLQEERDRTDILSDKTARLKAETIVSSLRQEFVLLYLIKHKIPTEASSDDLMEAYIKVEGFAAMPEPSADSQQRCTQFASQVASSSANVPPPAVSDCLNPLSSVKYRQFMIRP